MPNRYSFTPLSSVPLITHDLKRVFILVLLIVIVFIIYFDSLDELRLQVLSRQLHSLGQLEFLVFHLLAIELIHEDASVILLELLEVAVGPFMWHL